MRLGHSLALIIGTILVVLGLTQTASACPRPNADAVQHLSYAGADLYQPKRHDVVAGGRFNLLNCNINARGQAIPAGYVERRPDFELDFFNLFFELELRVRAECDTVLLVRTPNGNWRYSDDRGAGNNRNPQLMFQNPPVGDYQIWIGTYDSQPCNARLVLESH